MKIKKLLYFSGVKLNSLNLQILEKNINVIKINSIKDSKKLKHAKKLEIFSMYCDQNFFYSSGFLKLFPNLRYLISSTTATTFIDEKFCKKNKIQIISLENDTKFLKTITSTAEHALGLILMISRKYLPSIKSIEKKEFNRRPFGGYKMLSKSNLGIIGYGRLGKILKKISKNIFHKIYFADNKSKKIIFKRQLKNISEKCDFISIHIPAKENYDFFNKKNFPQFQKKFFLINTSRGEVINENFVLDLLKKRKILGYAADVLKDEFTEKFKLSKNLLFKNRKKYNILITPHIGGSTLDAWNLTEKRVINRFIKKI